MSILGLGYASGENQVHTKPPQEPYNNFPLALAEQGATNLALFSLWKDATDSHDGQVLFGGIDTSKYAGSLTTLETQNRTNYNEVIAFDIILNGLALSGDSSFQTGSTGSVPLVLDCGTSYSILPDDWIKPIYNQFDVTYFEANDTAYVDCDLKSNSYFVEYTFESLTIQVPISALVILRSLAPKICTFGLVPAGSRHSLLGDNFLSSVYTVFDLTNGQISLAARYFDSTADKILAVPAGGVKAMKSLPTNPTSTSTAAGTDSTGSSSGTGASPSETKKSDGSFVLSPSYLLGLLLFGFCIM